MALRDADTIELFAGFLAESFEGLDQVDQILLAAEPQPASAVQINALFRVFHTIEGVSAFLNARSGLNGNGHAANGHSHPESLIPFDNDSDLASF